MNGEVLLCNNTEATLGNTEQHWVQVTLARMFTDLQITRLNFSSQLSEDVGG